MAKFKIQKGLSDADMMKNFKDTENFEDTMLDREVPFPFFKVFHLNVEQHFTN